MKESLKNFLQENEAPTKIWYCVADREDSECGNGSENLAEAIEMLKYNLEEIEGYGLDEDEEEEEKDRFSILVMKPWKYDPDFLDKIDWEEAIGYSKEELKNAEDFYQSEFEKDLVVWAENHGYEEE